LQHSSSQEEKKDQLDNTVNAVKLSEDN